MTVDGYVLGKTPYEAYMAGEVPALAQLQGCNAEEGTPFLLFSMANRKNYADKVRALFGEYADEVLALYPAESDREAKENWIDLYSAWYFGYGHYCWARQAAAQGQAVYGYYFTKTNGRLGAWHSGEEVYCYGNIPADSRLYDASDRELGEIFSSYFANFARSGDPNGEGLPRWEPTEDGTRVLELGESVYMREERALQLYEILDRIQGFHRA